MQITKAQARQALSMLRRMDRLVQLTDYQRKGWSTIYRFDQNGLTAIRTEMAPELAKSATREELSLIMKEQGDAS